MFSSHKSFVSPPTDRAILRALRCTALVMRLSGVGKGTAIFYTLVVVTVIYGGQRGALLHAEKD